MIGGVWEFSLHPLTRQGSRNSRGGFEDCIEIIDFETVFDNGILTTINDNGVFTDVNWLPELEISDDDDVVDFPELIDMLDHFFDYCFTIDLVATMDDMCSFDGCAIATESDKFDMFMENIMQRIIFEEEGDRMIFMEEADDDVMNDHVEEEEINRPP